MHILKVAAQISALCEGLVADVTRERPLAGVFAEVVLQVAGFLEYRAAAGIHASEQELETLRSLVPHLDHLVVLIRHGREGA